MYTIKIKVKEREQSLVELKGIQPGQTLLEICLQHSIKIPHQCGGVCFCRTCHIYIEKGSGFLEWISKREIDFITGISDRLSNSRLACQCLLLEGEGEIEILLPKS
jgi:ferredoxin, 2Fe-2S